MDAAQKKVGKAYDANHSFKQAVKRKTNNVRRNLGRVEIRTQMDEALENLDNAPRTLLSKFVKNIFFC